MLGKVLQDAHDLAAIPHPRSLPLLGDVLQLSSSPVPVLKLCELGTRYGEIYTLKLLGQRYAFVSSQRLLKELCDEKRFEKVVVSDLENLRDAVRDGLFTAHNGEKNWDIAHRVLVPAFGPLKIREMFDPMKDIASQLVLKWARIQPGQRISVAEDFTRLTLDTLALCAMGYRFNSFYSDRMHTFVDAMVQFMKASEEKANTPSLFRAVGLGPSNHKSQESVKYMREMSRRMIQERKQHPQDTKDLLNAMILGRDPKTGDRMDEESMIDNAITFLVAGHETTSGALSFTFYFLLKHPDVLKKAQQEVDEVIGDRGVQIEHLSRLPYITAILRESLRLQPTAPGFTVAPKSSEGEILCGRYRIPHGMPVLSLLHNVQRDPAVYGDDAGEFRPDRMMDADFEQLPPGAWKPFGNGSRGCIGRPFAWQEMVLVMAMLLRYFDFKLDDPNYDLQIASTLTVKPKDFYMHAELRPQWDAVSVEKDMLGAIGSIKHEIAKHVRRHDSGIPQDNHVTMAVLYGSNSGTCEAFARTLAGDATDHGVVVTTVNTLDSAVDNLSTADMVAIVTTSYEGQPCDNAAEFYKWLQGLGGQGKINTSFAVFGCGHSDWKASLFRIPTAIDELLERNGGKRLCSMGTADAAKGDMVSDFHNWQDHNLWPAVDQLSGRNSSNTTKESAVDPRLTVDIVDKTPSASPRSVPTATVEEAKTLTAPTAPEKRHISLNLQSDTTYQAGDYCAIVPSNPPELVAAVMKRFGLADRAVLRLSSTSPTFLPLGKPIMARDLFSSYVELLQPASKRNLRMLISFAYDADHKAKLESLLNECFQEEITNRRVALFHLLQRYPTIQLPLAAFISALMPVKARLYSISSTPLKSATTACLTYSVLQASSRSGEGEHLGVATYYLAQLQPGDKVEATIRPSHFRLPEDPAKTPIIMVAAGTGLAPFRGFIEERSIRLKQGQKLAPAMLFYGCRHPDEDDLYRTEMDAWEAEGAVIMKRAYSRASYLSRGLVHVDDVLKEERKDFAKLWQDGAKVYVCGSRAMGDGVKRAVYEVLGKPSLPGDGELSQKDVDAWFEMEIGRERFVTDVFD